MKKSNAFGFSLVELLIVVAIIGILAAMAVPQYRAYVARSKAQQGKLILEELRAAQEQYRALKGTYTAISTDLENFGAKMTKGPYSIDATDISASADTFRAITKGNCSGESAKNDQWCINQDGILCHLTSTCDIPKSSCSCQ